MNQNMASLRCIRAQRRVINPIKQQKQDCMSPAAALVQHIIVETNTSQQITFSTKGRVNGTQSVNKHNRQKTKKMKEYESASYSLHGIDVDIRLHQNKPLFRSSQGIDIGTNSDKFQSFNKTNCVHCNSFIHSFRGSRLHPIHMHP